MGRAILVVGRRILPFRGMHIVQQRRVVLVERPHLARHVGILSGDSFQIRERQMGQQGAALAVFAQGGRQKIGPGELLARRRVHGHFAALVLFQEAVEEALVGKAVICEKRDV